MNDFTPTTTISIAIENGQPMVMHAEWFGQFAINRTIFPRAFKFSVTHVTTGAAVIQNIPLDRARDLAQTLEAEVPKFERLQGDSWLLAAAAIRTIMQQKSQSACLSALAEQNIESNSTKMIAPVQEAGANA